MKHLLLTTIAAVVLVGCGPPKPPDISIHDAAFDGNIEVVKQHLAAGVDANAGSGWTSLHEAAGEGHKKIVELLITAGANVNAKKEIRGNRTPLYEAAENGHKEVAELLITKGADVNAKSKRGVTPLDWTNNPDNPNDTAETADLLRKHGGKTGEELSIHIAAMNGNIEAVKKHLAAGVDVNATSKMWSGMTPLHIAAEGGHNEIAELLIAKGANVNAKTNDGETPLDKAVHHGQTEITGLLRKHSGKSGAEDSVHVAALVGNIEAVKQHLATGTDVNAKADDEWTPLHEAAWHGHKEIVELLIAKGADVKVKDGDGETPLDVATHPDNPNKNKAETANLLRKHGGKTGEELKAESK